MPFSSYDQWKTASPYDDDVDFADYGVRCPRCGTDQFQVIGTDASALEIDCECDDCSHTWTSTIPEKLIDRGQESDLEIVTVWIYPNDDMESIQDDIQEVIIGANATGEWDDDHWFLTLERTELQYIMDCLPEGAIEIIYR